MRRRFAIPGLVIALALPLYVVGLGWPLFWADEATTALLSRHVLERGVPYVGHGTNSASQAFDNMRALGDTDVHSSWLQYYLGAAALAAAGGRLPVDSLQSAERVTFMGRLPFALLGLGASAALFWMLRDALANGPNRRPADREREVWAGRVALAAFALSALSPAMVLHSRQFRYYAPAALLTVVVLHAYLVLHRGGRSRAAGLAAASTLLATANDLTWMAVHTAVAAHYALVERRRLDWRRLALPLVPAMATLAAWFALASTAHRYGRVALHQMPNSMLVYAAEVNAHLVPWIALAVGLPGLLACWRVKTRPVGTGPISEQQDAARSRVDDAWRVGSLFALVLLALVAAHSPVRHLFFRYLLAGAPLAAGLVALVLVPPVAVSRFARAGMLTCLALMIGSESVGFVADRLLPGRERSRYLTRMHERWRRPRTPADLITSFVDRRPGPLSEALGHLWTSASTDDVMVVTYGDQTLRFYSRFTILGGYGGELPPDGLRPDWIWLRADSPAHTGDADIGAWVRRNLDTRQYDVVELAVPDRSFEVREDPHDYWYLREGSWPRARLLHRRSREP